MTLLLALLMPAQAVLPEGRYALQIDVATDVQLPVVGWRRVVTRSVLLAEVESAAGDRRRQQQELCRVEVIGGRPATTVVPEAFIAAYPRQSYAVELRPTGDTLEFFADLGPTTVGYDPERAGGVVPTTATDAVLDFEGDGQPGATVKLVVPVLGTVDLYVVQRAHSMLRGEVRDGRVEGQVEVETLEQNTIGGTHKLFLGERPVRVAQDASRFWMVPLGPGAGCAEVLRVQVGEG